MVHKNAIIQNRKLMLLISEMENENMLEMNTKLQVHSQLLFIERLPISLLIGASCVCGVVLLQLVVVLQCECQFNLKSDEYVETLITKRVFF